MAIHEFWTFFTDVILSVLCGIFAFNLSRSSKALNDFSSRVWIIAFVTIGLAALCGAIYHGFQPHLPLMVYDGLRIFTLFCLSITAYLLSRSMLRFSLNPSHKFFNPIKWFLNIKLLAFLVVAVLMTQFIVGIADYGSAFLIGLWVYGRKNEHPASHYMIKGIVVSLVAAAIQILKISPHPNFNGNDLYHVVQIFGLYLFYKGTPLLTDRQ